MPGDGARSSEIRLQPVPDTAQVEWQFFLPGREIPLFGYINSSSKSERRTDFVFPKGGDLQKLQRKRDFGYIES